VWVYRPRGISKLIQGRRRNALKVSPNICPQTLFDSVQRQQQSGGEFPLTTGRRPYMSWCLLPERLRIDPPEFALPSED